MEVEDQVSFIPTRAKAKHHYSPVKKQGLSSKATKMKPKSVKKMATQPAMLNDSSVRPKVTEVPCFMEAAWSTVFLPMLYDSLGCSMQPFADFAKGQKVEGKLQEAIDFVWPDTDFKIQWYDAPCSKVSIVQSCNHLHVFDVNHRLLIASTRNKLSLGLGLSKLLIISSKDRTTSTIPQKLHNMHSGQLVVMALHYILNLPQCPCIVDADGPSYIVVIHAHIWLAQCSLTLAVSQWPV